MALTEDARKELREAIQIIREDKLESFLRQRFSDSSSKASKKDEVIEDDEESSEDGPTPPPVKEEPTPEKETPKSRSRYWGELLDD